MHERLGFTKGILYETLAYYAVTTRLSHKQAVTDILKWARWMVASKVHWTPTGENDLTEEWTAAERQVAVYEFSRLAEMAIEALRAEAAGDEDAARRRVGEWPGSRRVQTCDSLAQECSPPGMRAALPLSGRPTTTSVGVVAPTPGRGWLSA